MRMRRKKNLDSRIDKVQNLLLARQGYDFYKLEAEQRQKYLNLSEIFENDNPVALEIGCGKGQFITEMAQNNHCTNYIAVEKLSNVIVEACEKASQFDLPNLRFLNCGAENLLNFLQPKSISCIYLNFSCPYPKHTYANRRLTYKRYLDIYKTLLVNNGYIMLKTDNKDFFQFSIQQLGENNFEISELTDDLHNSPYAKDNIVTEYEQKFIEQGFNIHHLKATYIE